MKPRVALDAVAPDVVAHARRVSVRARAPGTRRCPFCHDGLAAGEALAECAACRTGHHEECLLVEGARCATCGVVPPRARSRLRRALVAAGLLAIGLRALASVVHEPPAVEVGPPAVAETSPIAAPPATDAPVADPRLARPLTLDRAIELSRDPTVKSSVVDEALLEFDSMDSLLAHLAVMTPPRAHGVSFGVAEAVELFAATGSRDPRPRAAIEAILADPRATVAQRFSAFYLRELLDTPSFPTEPPGYDGGAAMWRAVLRSAQALVADVQIRDGRHELVPSKARVWTPMEGYAPEALVPAFAEGLGRKVFLAAGTKLTLPTHRCCFRFGDRRALAAFAALNGCRLVERDDGALEIAPRAAAQPPARSTPVSAQPERE